MSNYVDTLTCTWNPSSNYDFVADMPHPASLDPTIQLTKNPEKFHTDLVNKCQRHICSNKCLRIDKRTKQKKCKFSFPKKFVDTTKIVVLPYSRNQENQDIYYKVEIHSKRNDAWLNQFSRLILDNWQVLIFLSYLSFIPQLFSCSYIS